MPLKTSAHAGLAIPKADTAAIAAAVSRRLTIMVTPVAVASILSDARDLRSATTATPHFGTSCGHFTAGMDRMRSNQVGPDAQSQRSVATEVTPLSTASTTAVESSDLMSAPLNSARARNGPMRSSKINR